MLSSSSTSSSKSKLISSSLAFNEELKSEMCRAAKRSAIQKFQKFVVTFLGPGGSGKTSTIRAIQGRSFDSIEDSTHCVSITEASVETSHLTRNAKNGYYDFDGTIPWINFDDVDYSNYGKKKNDDDKDEKQLQPAEEFDITFWDYCGLSVFRTVQHPWMIRNSCCVVVFNMYDLLMEEKQEEELEGLHFWFQSIKHHASCKDKELQAAAVHDGDSSNLYPPVILVGTRYDHIKRMAGPSNKSNVDGVEDEKTEIFVHEKLEEINKILMDNFGHLGIFATSAKKSSSKNDSSATNEKKSVANSTFFGFKQKSSPQNEDTTAFQGREALYNSEQDLCFWPVENYANHKENKSGISTLRSTIVKAVMNDPFNYVNQQVPSSWLHVIGKIGITRIRKPVLPMEAISDVMKEVGTLHDLAHAKALTKFCRDIGLFIYYDNVPGLEDIVILKPYWLSSNIIPIIRDIKLHRLYCDSSAMHLEDAKYWIEMRDEAILDMAILKKFWYTLSSKDIELLLSILQKLKLFAPFTKKVPLESGAKSGEGETLEFRKKFAVPSLYLNSFWSVDTLRIDYAYTPRPRVEKYLEISSLEQDGVCHSAFVFNDFLPDGCFSEMIASIIEEWNEGYSTTSPKFSLSTALLNIGVENRFALVFHLPARLPFPYDGKEGRKTEIRVITQDEAKMKFIFPKIKSKLDDVIKVFFRDTIQYSVRDGTK